MTTMYTEIPVPDDVCAAAANALREQRVELAASLATLVADWPKYAALYATDPAAFADTESLVLVDYIAGLIGSGDENWQHLYIGEKAKQFHDPDVPATERRARETQLLVAERAIFRAAVAEWPEAEVLVDARFTAIEHVLIGDAPIELFALFVGDCLYLDVIAFLSAQALADGVRLRPTFVTSHDSAEVCAALGRLAHQRFDAVFYSPFSYAFVADYELLQRPRVALLPWRAQTHVVAAVTAAERIFDTAADLFDCPLVTHLPAAIVRNAGTSTDRMRALATAPARAAAVRALRASFVARAARRRADGQVVELVDEEAIVAPVGGWAAGRFLYRSSLQHPARFGALVAERYRDLVLVLAGFLKRKLIICDLDNTLWAGVIGEGLGVKHYADRQQPLLRLKERGVVLAINSKNDAAKVGWDDSPGRLSLADFVSCQINWDPKPLNVQRIADHVNLKPKDFVFVDDRADERAMVEQAFPAILSLNALDPRSWRLFNIWADLLPVKPGADRTSFYRQRDARQSFIATDAEASVAQRAELFGELGLVLTVREANDGDVSRITELVNRTNQFNMTGSRVTSRQVVDWVASSTASVLIADARDRFGAMGTISALVSERTTRGVAIPVFVLSCRVFGYGMEFALLKAAYEMAGGEAEVFGAFRETEHNQPCHGVYAQAGFVRVEGGWRGNQGGGGISVPDWLSIESLL